MLDTKLLRQKILDLAIRGKLVPQDPTDEPASELLKKIKAEKDALFKAGKIKKDKHESHIFKGDDNRYYETIDGKTADITDEIPFDLPAGWAWCRLGEIGNILYGVSESAKANGCYKLLRITDIQNDNVNWQSVPFTDFSGDATTYFLRDGDIVFARTGATVGKSFLIESAPKNAIYASYLIRVRFIFATVAKFIKNFFGSSAYWEQIIAKSVGTGQPNVNGTSLSELFLPIPPLSEQQRIVEQIETLLRYVDIIDTDAETLEKSITLAKQKILDLAIRGKLVPQDPADEPASELLKKIKAEKDTLVKAGKIKKDKHESYIFKSDDNCYYEQLNGKTVDITAEIPFELPESWCWCRLRSLGQIVGGGTPSTTNQMFWNGSIPWLSPSDLTGYTDMYIAHGKKSITEEGIEKSSAVLMPAGSVLYSSRAPIGYVVISKNLISTNQGFKSLVPAVAGMSEFYYFVLKARTSDIKQRATGTTFKEISGNDFGNTLVPLPPITEQKRIVQAIAQYNSILELISK